MTKRSAPIRFFPKFQYFVECDSILVPDRRDPSWGVTPCRRETFGTFADSWTTTRPGLLSIKTGFVAKKTVQKNTADLQAGQGLAPLQPNLPRPPPAHQQLRMDMGLIPDDLQQGAFTLTTIRKY